MAEAAEATAVKAALPAAAEAAAAAVAKTAAATITIKEADAAEVSAAGEERTTVIVTKSRIRRQ